MRNDQNEDTQGYSEYEITKRKNRAYQLHCTLGPVKCRPNKNHYAPKKKLGNLEKTNYILTHTVRQTYLY